MFEYTLFRADPDAKAETACTAVGNAGVSEASERRPRTVFDEAIVREVIFARAAEDASADLAVY